MKTETKGKLTFGFWGVIFGAIIAMIIGFVWAGWTTSWTSEKMSKNAVVASQAAICVAQFMKEPNHEEKLKAFADTGTYGRAGFVEDGGWDKMPGQKEASFGVAQACADGLALLIKE